MTSLPSREVKPSGAQAGQQPVPDKKEATASTTAAAPAKLPEPSPKPSATPGASDDELAKQTRLLALEKRRLANKAQQIEEKEKALHKQLEDASRGQPDLANAKTNPAAFLEKAYGPKWREFLTDYQVSGNAPLDAAADQLRQEMAAKVQGLEKKLAEREAAFLKAEADRKAEDDRRHRESHDRAAMDFAKANAKKYVTINAWEAHQAVPKEIEEHFLRTTTVDPSTGERIPGELLTYEQAADKVEARLAKLYEARRAADAATQQAPTATTPDSPQRRSLSTDLAAFSTGTPNQAPLSRREAFAKAEAAAAQSLRERGRIT